MPHADADVPVLPEPADVYTSLYSPYPKFISHILFFYMISLLGLFGHFYYQKHLSGRAKRDEKKTQ